MKIIEFQEGVARTFNKKNYELDLLHCTIGLLTEIGEIFESPDTELTNKREESGDIYWYLGALGNVIKVDLTIHIHSIEVYQTIPVTVKEAKAFLVIQAGNLADVIKRHVYYSKPMTLLEKIHMGLKLFLNGETDKILKAETYYHKPLDKEKLVRHINAVWQTLATYGMHFNLTTNECLIANQAKLRERFKDKFTETQALNRNLAAEFRALKIK